MRKDLAYTLLKVGETTAARDQFAEAADGDGADISRSTERLSCRDRSCLNGLHRRHSPPYHRDELFSVISIGINTAIGTEHHFHASLERRTESFTLLKANHSLLVH